MVEGGGSPLLVVAGDLDLALEEAERALLLAGEERSQHRAVEDREVRRVQHQPELCASHANGSVQPLRGGRSGRVERAPTMERATS